MRDNQPKRTCAVCDVELESLDMMRRHVALWHYDTPFSKQVKRNYLCDAYFSEWWYYDDELRQRYYDEVIGWHKKYVFVKELAVVFGDSRAFTFSGGVVRKLVGKPIKYQYYRDVLVAACGLTKGFHKELYDGFDGEVCDAGDAVEHMEAYPELYDNKDDELCQACF
jgi:hypothetical protein